MADNVIVTVMPTSQAAYDLADAIKSDGNENFSVKTGAVIRKDDLGNVEYLEEKDRTLWGTIGGTAVGALIGAFGGPPGVLAGGALGAAAGLAGDAIVSSDDEDYVNKVMSDMPPGTAALIIEADEENRQYFDNMAVQYGGLVYRPTEA